MNPLRMLLAYFGMPGFGMFGMSADAMLVQISSAETRAVNVASTSLIPAVKSETNYMTFGQAAGRSARSVNI
jgi:hypothetical protein